jgi:hypothetical protein
MAPFWILFLPFVCSYQQLCQVCTCNYTTLSVHCNKTLNYDTIILPNWPTTIHYSFCASQQHLASLQIQEIFNCSQVIKTLYFISQLIQYRHSQTNQLREATTSVDSTHTARLHTTTADVNTAPPQPARVRTPTRQQTTRLYTVIVDQLIL